MSTLRSRAELRLARHRASRPSPGGRGVAPFRGARAPTSSPAWACCRLPRAACWLSSRLAGGGVRSEVDP
eukprot:3827061-Alexandrium_andersonii.AAC.1